MLAAGIIGVGSLIAYGVSQSRDRSRAHDAAEQVSIPSPTEAPTIQSLVARAQRARSSLDTVTLSRVEVELADAANKTTTAPKALVAHTERLAVLSTLALEGTIRAAILGDERAREQAAAAANEGQALIERLEPKTDPGLLLTARARFALAAGADLPETHPVVLLPSFRDRELQLTVLARPLWDKEAEADLDKSALDDLVTQVEVQSEPSGLERILLALALDRNEQSARSLTLTEEVLRAAPGQPLAEGLRLRYGGEARVAMADPSPPVPVSGRPAKADKPAPPPEAKAQDPAPSETKAQDPAPPPETKAQDPEPPPETKTEQPAPPPETKAEQPSPPSETKAQEPSPPPETKTSSPSARPPKASGTGGGSKPKRKSPAELTAEGCKLVRSGKAADGFKLLQKAFDLNPGDTKVTLCMAEAHLKLGRLPSARAMVERILKKSGRNKRALLLAAKIQDKLGNKKDAVKYYRKVLEVDPGNAKAQAYVDKNG